MATSRNVVFDNAGSPDSYVVQTVCKMIRLIEKDRSAATLAVYNIYLPNSVAAAIQMRGGEPWEIPAGNFFMPGDIPFQAETVNVGSSTFAVQEL